MRAPFFAVPTFVGTFLVACSSDDTTPSPVAVDSGTPETSVTPEAGLSDAAVEDTGTSSGNKLVSGDGFAIAYSDNTTVDARPSVKVTFDASGFLTGYETKNVDERPLIGGATNDGAKTNGVAAVGRWIGGPTAGTFYGAQGKTYASADDGFHWAVGKLAPDNAVPTGSAVYELDLSDNATMTGLAAPGHVTTFTITFSASADGGAPTSNATLTHDLNGGGTVSAAGYVTAGGAGFSPQVRADGGGLVYAGLFVGTNAERIVLATATPIRAALTLKKK